MKFLTRIGFTLFIGWFILFACSKDESVLPPDTKAPMLTITPSQDLDQSLFGIVTLMVEATDDNKIASVEVLVDGVFLLTATTSPFHASWDTRTVADGAHTIKIVAMDGVGNEAVETYEVNVRNTLYTFTVADGFLTGSHFNWLFISDEAGKSFEVQKVVNGTTLKFNYPESHTPGAKYSFTRVDRFDKTLPSPLFGIYTFMDVPAGDYKLSGLGPSRGVHSRSELTITGIDNLTVENAGSFGESLIRFDVTQDEPNNKLTIESSCESTDPLDLVYYLFRNNGSPPVYAFVHDVQNEGSSEVALGDMATMSSITINLPGAESSYYSLGFFEEEGNFLTETSLGSSASNPEELILYYPPIAFPAYETFMGYTIGNEGFSYTQIGPNIATQFKKMEVELTEFSVKNNVMNVTADGLFDYIATYSIKPSTGPGVYRYSRSIYMPGNVENKYALPEIPEEVYTENPFLKGQKFTFDQLSFSEYSGMEGYTDYLDLHFVHVDFFEKGSTYILTKGISQEATTN